MDNPFLAVIDTMQKMYVGNPSEERYFAVVIKADGSLGGLLSASTNLGDHLREREKEALPSGAKITRCIEITKDMATRPW